MLKPFMHHETLPAGCPSKSPDPFEKVFQELHGCVRVYMDGQRGAAFLEGDCTLNQAVAELTLYREQNRIGAAREIFIDLTHYSGTVDWSLIATLPSRGLWKPPPQKLAFLVGSEPLAKLAKVAGLFIRETKSRVFIDPYEAHSWLGWDKR